MPQMGELWRAVTATHDMRHQGFVAGFQCTAAFFDQTPARTPEKSSDKTFAIVGVEAPPSTSPTQKAP